MFHIFFGFLQRMALTAPNLSPYHHHHRSSSSPSLPAAAAAAAAAGITWTSAERETERTLTIGWSGRHRRVICVYTHSRFQRRAVSASATAAIYRYCNRALPPPTAAVIGLTVV